MRLIIIFLASLPIINKDEYIGSTSRLDADYPISSLACSTHIIIYHQERPAGMRVVVMRSVFSLILTAGLLTASFGFGQTPGCFSPTSAPEAVAINRRHVLATGLALGSASLLPLVSVAKVCRFSLSV
jgi:hypothetical protein